MKSVEWKTYRTRFLVQAKQLSCALSFVDPLGRTHCGRRGDYLVESSDGVISIAPRQIFEDIYVPIPPDEVHANEKSDEKNLGEGQITENSLRESGISERKFASVSEKKRVVATKLARAVREEKLCACPTSRLNIEPLDMNMEEIEFRPMARRPITSSRDLRREENPRVRRKLPQAAADRTPSPRLGLM